MKIGLLKSSAVMLFALFTIVAFGQKQMDQVPKNDKRMEHKMSAEDKEKMLDKRVERMSKEYNLSDDQKSKVKAHMKDSFGRKQEMHAKMKDQNAKDRAYNDEKMKSILTNEQYQKYSTDRAARAEKAHKKGKMGKSKKRGWKKNHGGRGSNSKISPEKNQDK